MLKSKIVPFPSDVVFLLYSCRFCLVHAVNHFDSEGWFNCEQVILQYVVSDGETKHTRIHACTHTRPLGFYLGQLG